MRTRPRIALEDDACDLCLAATDSGVGTPPFHPLCRCAVVMKEDAYATQEQAAMSEMSQPTQLRQVVELERKLTEDELKMIRTAWEKRSVGDGVNLFRLTVADLTGRDNPTPKPKPSPSRIRSKSTKVKRRIVLE